MTVLHLAHKLVSRQQVDIAWATYKAMRLAEVDDPSLANDLAHQQATEEAFEKYRRLFDEWSRQC
jgi:hypothetical protein